MVLSALKGESNGSIHNRPLKGPFKRIVKETDEWLEFVLLKSFQLHSFNFLTKILFLFKIILPSWK